jgi:ADP-ribose pyrophosphatase
MRFAYCTLLLTAERSIPQGASLDDGEHLEVLTLSLPAALEWIREGKITDNKTVSGLFLAEKLLCGEW